MSNGQTRLVTRLYLRRREMGLTQKDAERELGITHSLYSALEQGRIHRPYPYMIEKCEDFFKMKMERLLEEIEVQEIVEVKNNGRKRK